MTIGTDESIQLSSACPPHQWGHMPTVGGFHCMKCQRTVMHNEPEYDEITRARTASSTREAAK